jgi:hypothetical protein
LRLEPNMSGKSYLQKDDKTKKKVMFAEDKLKQLEYCHNLVSQVKPEKEQIIEYGLSQAMLIARFIQDIMMNVKQHGASFAQQYILQKGLKVFGSIEERNRSITQENVFCSIKGKRYETIQKEEGTNGANVSHGEEGQECER